MKSKSTLRAAILAGSIAALLAAPAAQATLLYWDTNGTGSAGSGAATGTWGTDAFWTTDATGANVGSPTLTAVTTNADDLFFSAGTNGTTGTVTIDTTQAAHSITFDDPVALTLSGGTAINLGSATAGSGLFFTGNAANVISTPIILNSTATAVAITNSTASLQTIGDITGTAGTQTLTVGATSTGGITLGGIIGNGGGTVGLTVNSRGTGITTLTAANTYTGTTTINAGTLVVGNGTTGSLNGIIGTALTFTGSGTVNFNEAAGVNQGMGVLTLTAGQGTVQSTWAGSGTNSLTFTNVIARSAGASANFVQSGGVNGTDNSIILTQYAGANTVAGALIDRGVFFNGDSYATANAANGFLRAYLSSDTNASTAAAGANTITVASSNVFVTGAVTAQAAIAVNTINLGNNTIALSGALQTNGILASGGTLAAISGSTIASTTSSGEMVIRVNAASNVLTISSQIVNNGTTPLTKSGDGTLILTSNNTYTGTTRIGSGTLQLGNGGAGAAQSTGSIIVAAGGNLAFNNNNTSGGMFVFNNSITGSGGVTLSAGQVALYGGTNTYSGGFTLNGGYLATGSSAASIGTGTLTLNGGTFSTSSSGGAGALLITTNANIWSGNFGLDSRVTAGSMTWNNNGNVLITNSSRTVTGTVAPNLNLGGVISDGGNNYGLTFNGMTSVSMSGVNTYTGSTTIGAGTFTISGAGSLNSGNYAAALTATSSAVTYSSSANQILSGVVSATTLTKNTDATSTLTLSGAAANVISGAVAVSAGTLALSKVNGAVATLAFGNGGLTVGSAGTTAARVNYAAATTNPDMMGTGAVSLLGRGILDFNGATDTIGAVTITATGAGANTTPITNTNGLGNLTIGTLGITPATGFTSVANAGTGTITLGGAVTFTAAGSGQAQITGTTLALGGADRTFTVGLGTGATQDLLVDAQITGARLLTKAGVGRMTVTAPAHTLGTTVSAGTLLLSGANNMPTAGTLAISAGGTFSLADGTARATTGASSGVGLTLATGSTMAFDWNGASLDSFTTAGSASATGTVVININNTSPTGGGGTLITAASGTLNGATYLLANNTNYTATISSTATTVSIGAQTPVTALTDAYWKGNQVAGATGSMAVSTGTLSNWATDASPGTATGLTPGSSTNVIFSASGATLQSSVIAGADMSVNSITFNDSTAVTIGGSSNTIILNSTSGTAATSSGSGTTVTAGSAISVTSSAAATNTISTNLALGANQTWNIASTKNLTVSGAVSGAFSLTKADAGTLTLSSASNTSSYSGGTNIAAGTLSFASGALGTAGNVTFTGNSTLQWASGNTQDISSRLVMTNGVTSTLDTQANNVTFASTFGSSSTGSLTKSGAGMLSITGIANTYTGTTTLSAGTLQAFTLLSNLSVSPFGTSALQLNGGTLALGAPASSGAGSEDVTYGNNTTVGGNVIISADRSVGAGSNKTMLLGTLSIGANTLTATTTLGTGNAAANAGYIVGFGATTASGAATFTNTVMTTGGLRLASLTLANSVTTGTTTTITFDGGTGTTNTITGVVSNNSADSTKVLSLTKTGAGTLSLTSASSTFTGGTFINAGTVSYTADGALGASGFRNVTFGGTATLTGFDGSSLNQLTASSGTGTITGQNITFASTAGSGTLRYSGGQNKLLNIGNASAFTGNLVFAYNANNASGIGTPHIQFSSLNDAVGSSIQFFRIGGGTDSGQNGQVALFGDVGPLTFNNRQIQFLPKSGTTNPSMRDIVLMNNNTNAANTWVINTNLLNSTYDRDVNFYLTGGNTGNNAFNGTIGNPTGFLLSLVKAGTGTWILGGTNNYTGLTTVSGGKLIMTKPSSLGNGGLNVGSNTFIYAPTIAGALNLGSGVLTQTGGTIGTALGGTASQSAITSTGAAVLSGTGVVNIYGITGVAPTAGSNNLITALSGLTGGTYTLGAVFNNADFTVSGFTRAAGTISVTVAAATPITTAFWKGGLTGFTSVWAASNGSTASNWTTTAGGAVQVLTPGSTADVTISATSPTTAPTATVLGANMTIKSLTIADTTNGLGVTADGFTLTIANAAGITMNASVPTSTIGASIALGADQTWTNNSANSLTVSGAVSGAFALTKEGTGIVTLLGGNSYSGATTVNAGILNFGRTAAKAAGTVTTIAAGSIGLGVGGVSPAYYTTADVTALFNTNTLTGFNLVADSGVALDTTSGNFTHSTALTAARALTKLGTNTLTLTGPNTYTGTTTLSAGTLSIQTVDLVANANPLGQSTAVAGNLILNGGTLQVTGGAAGTTDRLFSLQSSSSIDASGSAALIFSNIGSMGFNGGTAAKTLTLTGSNTNANSIAAIIGDNTGATSVSKNGVGNWTLSGNNTYTGTTGVSNGTLILSGNNTTTGTITVSGAIGATLTLSGDNSGMTSNVTLTTATGTSSLSPLLNINSNTALGTGILNFGGGAASDVVRIDNTSAGAVTVSTANAITLNRNFTFVGTQNLNMGTGTTTIGSASRSIIVTGNTITFDGIVTETTPGTSNFGITLGGNGTLSLTNQVNTFSGKTVIGNNTGSSLKLQVTKLADLGIASSLGAPTTAALGLIQIGSQSNPSTLELVGGTSASTTNRQIQIGSSSNGSGGSTILNNNTNALHTLTFSNAAFNVAATGLTGSSRNLTLGGSNTGDNTVSGAIIPNTGGAGTTGLIKSGTGTWVLNGTSSFTGAVSVQDGTLKVNSIKDSGTNSAVGAGTLIALGSGSTTGTLVYTGTGDSATRSIRVGSGTVGDTGGGVLNSSGAGALTFTAATFNTAAAGVTVARNLTLGGTYTGGINEIQGAIVDNDTGTGGIVSITKSDAGTWKLSGTNTYTGATSVTAGTLQLDGSTHASSTVGIATAGTLSGTGTVNGNATLTGSGIINKSSGTLAGTLGVTGGNWNGAGAVTGLVTSSSGVFNIGSAGNLTANGDLAVTGGSLVGAGVASTLTGSLNYTSTTGSNFGGVIAGSGKTVTMNAASTTLTLSGTNTYTGLTDVQAGTLAISGGAAIANTGAVNVAAVAGATLLVSASETIGSLSGGSGANGTVALGVNTLTVGDASTTTFGGTITGTATTGTLVKQGAGVLNLAPGAVLTFDTLTANAGTLNVNSALGTGTGTGVVAVNNAGTKLRFGSVSQTLSSLTIGAGSTVIFTSGAASGSFSGGGGKAPSLGGGSAVVPEPGTLGLLLVGALGVLNRRRRA